MDIAVSFLVNQNKGYANVTTFAFAAAINPISSAKKIMWNFGDGSYNNSPSTTHIYKSPGNYKVSLIVYTDNSNPIISEQNLEVNLLINESIYFDYVPPPSFAGHYNRYPFRVHITSADLRDHYINLGVQFSKSSPPPPSPNKWSFLKPQWKFFDLEGNQISKIKTTDTLIKVNSAGYVDPLGSIVAGVTGFAEFYFSDDIYNFDLAINRQPYSTILASLETFNIDLENLQHKVSNNLSGFANTGAIATCPYVSLWRTPDYLKITENGINSHTNPRWSTSQIPVIVNSHFLQDYPDDHPDGNSIKPIRKDSFFVHNFPLDNASTINLKIGLDSLSSNFYPTPEFKWTDEYLNKIPGYYKGFFDVPDVNSFNARITAEATIPIPTLSGNYICPILWVSNPQAGKVHTAQYTYQNNLSAALSPNLSAAQIYGFDMPITTSGLSGIHGIYSIAALPAPQYHAYLLDSDLQYLYRVNTRGDILSSINIKEALIRAEYQFSIPDIVSPATMVLDGNKHLWITLHDSTSAIKMDNLGNVLFAVSPLNSLSSSSIINSLSSLYDQETYFSTNSLSSSFDDINLLEPTYIDSDTENNVWISYTSPYSGILTKYSSDGDLQSLIPFPSNRIPQELVCDKDNNFWLSLKDFNSPNFYIERRNYNGTRFADNSGTNYLFGPYSSVNNLTIDNQQNLWFTHDYNLVSKIDSSTYITQTLTVSGSNSSKFDSSSEETALEGICADITNKIYVINSVENQIYVIDGSTFSIENYFIINPQGFVYFLNENDVTESYYQANNKSLQAIGDWSGFRWINKYSNQLSLYSSTSSTTIFGKSPMLDFYVDNTFAYNLFKTNENYNLAKQMKSIAFSPKMQQSENLFDDFFGSIFGKENLNQSDLGVNVYEKIANFVNNHKDIDFCNIDQLYDISAMIDLNTDDFRLNFPDSVKRILDLASININKLFGQSNFSTLEFSTENSTNKGVLLTSNYTISAGVPVILKEKNTDYFKLIYTGKINKQKNYTLNQLAEFLELPENWYKFYEFYEYKLQVSNTSLSSEIIDWSNNQTTILKQKAPTYINSLGDIEITNFNPEKISISDNNGSYPSITEINLTSNELNILSDGDPFPSKAGVLPFTNDGLNPRGSTQYFPSIVKRKLNYSFEYRGGTNSLNFHIVRNDPIGLTTTGVLLYGPGAASPILPNLITSSSEEDIKAGISTPYGEFMWHKAFMPERYQRDLAGGYVDENGWYSYSDGTFLKSAWQDYKVWSKNSYYNNSSFEGDHFRHSNGHSKIIGFCFDGYPIYGPYGYLDPYSAESETVQLSSSYVPYGPNSYVIGRLPNFSYEEWPCGTFTNDYKFDSSLAVSNKRFLDTYNGRFSITPEFPQGTYAYFLTFSDSNLTSPQYPYISGEYTKQYRSTNLKEKIKLPISLQEWEGTNGILETMFSYELYKGLNLLK